MVSWLITTDSMLFPSSLALRLLIFDRHRRHRERFGFAKPSVGELHHPPLFQKTTFMCRDTDTNVVEPGFYDSGMQAAYKGLKLTARPLR